jgi:hypothetical protein
MQEVDPRLAKFMRSLDALAKAKGLATARRCIPRAAWMQDELDTVAIIFNTHSQEDLHLAMHKGISALEDVDKNSPEFDVINEALDMVWLALGGDEDEDGF